MSIFNRIFGNGSSEDKIFEERGLKKLITNDYHEALQDFMTALKHNPNNILALSQVGTIHTTLNNHSSAIQTFEKLIRLSSDSIYDPLIMSYYYSLGYNYFKLFDYTKGLTFFTIAEEYLNPSFPQLPQLYYYRGMCLLNLAKTKESIEDFNKAIQLKVDYESAYSFRGYAHMQLKMYDAAVLDYNQAAILNPNPSRADFEVYTNYGVCLFNTGNYEEAKLKFQKAIELNSDNETARKGLEITYRKLESSSRLKTINRIITAPSLEKEKEKVDSFPDSNGQLLFLGDFVIHPKFGSGKIIFIYKYKEGDTVIADINFEEVGKKTLHTPLAKLAKKRGS